MPFHTLYGKLAITLLGLLLAVGATYILLTAYFTKNHLRETSQELNRTLAANLIKERDFIRNGNIQVDAVATVFESFMVINPSIELYLLDHDGKILSYSAPKGAVMTDQINLAPINQFLDDQPLPILGDDPRAVGRKKIFSAAPLVGKNNELCYLYVVLRGENYDSISDVLGDSYILRIGSWVTAGSLALALISGLFLFSQYTRRLTRLSETMTQFRNSDLSQHTPNVELTPQSEDEIGKLESSFNDLAKRVILQLKELRETDTYRCDMVANISHDLRTPLASMQGYLETLLLKDGELDPEKQREYIEIALRHSHRMGKLIKDLFELARLDSGDIDIDKTNFSLHELAFDIMQKHQLDAEQRGISLSCNDANDTCNAYGDIGLIERVLENLIENAIRHCNQNGSVKINITGNSNNVQVRVTDTGKGIPSDELNHIFNRFYQVDKHRTNKNGSAGLGLAIVKRILDLHHSDIEVSSEVDKGTEFSFALGCAITQANTSEHIAT
ncbi:MAG: HAMP domain-containing histidine kinase [Gammaproteobacteria bacterium]|nr:HAMP domain-containing histidine kinase [Gammaproteobacteria bacterium]